MACSGSVSDLGCGWKSCDRAGQTYSRNSSPRKNKRVQDRSKVTQLKVKVLWVELTLMTLPSSSLLGDDSGSTADRQTGKQTDMEWSGRPAGGSYTSLTLQVAGAQFSSPPSVNFDSFP